MNEGPTRPAACRWAFRHVQGAAVLRQTPMHRSVVPRPSDGVPTYGPATAVSAGAEACGILASLTNPALLRVEVIGPA